MKIEFDIPEFEKELSVSIVIRKDGEVVDIQEKATPSSNPETIEEKTVEKITQKKSSKKNSGNLMDSDMF